jgi:hypothetical protein
VILQPQHRACVVAGFPRSRYLCIRVPRERRPDHRLATEPVEADRTLAAPCGSSFQKERQPLCHFGSSGARAQGGSTSGHGCHTGCREVALLNRSREVERR